MRNPTEKTSRIGSRGLSACSATGTGTRQEALGYCRVEKQEQGRFLRKLKARPLYSALSGVTENSPSAAVNRVCPFSVDEYLGSRHDLLHAWDHGLGSEQVHHPRFGQAGFDESQGSHGPESCHGRIDQDPGQASREIPHRKGSQRCDPGANEAAGAGGLGWKGRALDGKASSAALFYLPCRRPFGRIGAGCMTPCWNRETEEYYGAYEIPNHRSHR